MGEFEYTEEYYATRYDPWERQERVTWVDRGPFEDGGSEDDDDDPAPDEFCGCPECIAEREMQSAEKDELDYIDRWLMGDE